MLKEKAVRKIIKKDSSVKRKGCKKDNKEKDSAVKRKGCKEDNKEKDSDDSENNNNNDNNNNDNDNDSLINKMLSNFNDNVLNNLFIIAKLKKELLINIEKIRAIFNKIENIPKDDLKSKLDKYKNLNILLDDLINHIWRMIHSKNRVNNEIDNIDCDKR